MTTLRKRVLIWLLSGAAILLVAASAGCAEHCWAPRQHRDATGDSSARMDPGAPVFQPVRFEGPAVAVNVFGEFDGMPRATAARPTSESGFQQHTFVEEGYDGDVAVCPEGRWLVFSSTRHNAKANIYLQRVDGLSVIQLTNDDADNAFPVFSPDVQRIAFSSTRAGTWDIYMMDRYGRNVVQITSGPGHDLHPSFSPDGTRLVYCSMSNRTGQWELWTVDLRTNQKRMIGHGLFPSWSPDRSRDRIAFQRARARGSRWFSLWTLDLIDGEARNLTEIAASANAAIVSPTWSPDGTKLAFSTIVEPTTLVDGKPVGQQDVWVINADGTARQRITDGRGTNAAPYWGRDQRVYFVSDRGGTECIWSASARDVAAPLLTNVKDRADEIDARRHAIGSAGGVGADR